MADELNQESLQKQLAAYKAAVEQEFVLTEQHQEGLDYSSINEKTRDMLTHAVPIAVAKLVHLVNFADKETTQLSAAKYIIDYALGKGKLEAPDDPIKDLMISLNKSRVEAESKESTDSEAV
jgi:hypothetical protein